MFGFLHFLDLFCRSVAEAIANIFLSLVLNASWLLSFHRFHGCLDFRILWICFVGRWPWPSQTCFLSPVLNVFSFLAVHMFSTCLELCVFWICFVGRWP